MKGVRWFGESSRRYVLRRSAQGTTRQVHQQQPVVQEVTDIASPFCDVWTLAGQKGRALEQVRHCTGATMRSCLHRPRTGTMVSVVRGGPSTAAAAAWLLAITQCRNCFLGGRRALRDRGEAPGDDDPLWGPLKAQSTPLQSHRLVSAWRGRAARIRRRQLNSREQVAHLVSLFIVAPMSRIPTQL